MNATSFILLALGLALGAAIGFLLAKSRSSATIAALSATLDETRSSATQQLDAVRMYAAEQLQLANLTQEKMRETFAALSSDALHKNSTAFIERADELIKRVTAESTGDLEKRQQAIELLVSPLKETLTNVEKQMKDVEKERTDAYAALRTQVAQMGKTSEKLQQDTSQLVAALRAPQTRGAWGEHQLRQVVDFAGMIEHCDFGEQQSVSTRRRHAASRPHRQPGRRQARRRRRQGLTRWLPRCDGHRRHGSRRCDDRGNARASLEASRSSLARPHRSSRREGVLGSAAEHA